MTQASTPPSKTDYIRSQPFSLSAADVIARAKERYGWTLPAQFIHTVRSQQRKRLGQSAAADKTVRSPRSTPKPARAARSSAKSALKARNKKPGSIVDLLRAAAPATAATAPAVAAAADKAPKDKLAKAPAPAAPKLASSTGIATRAAQTLAVHADEQLFCQLIVRFGTERARSLVDLAEKRFTATA